MNGIRLVVPRQEARDMGDGLDGLVAVGLDLGLRRRDWGTTDRALFPGAAVSQDVAVNRTP